MMEKLWEKFYWEGFELKDGKTSAKQWIAEHIDSYEDGEWKPEYVMEVLYEDGEVDIGGGILSIETLIRGGID
jgi:hypothetical protein